MWHCSHHFYDELLGPIVAPNTTSPPVAAPEPATATRVVTIDPKRGKDRGKSRYFPSTIHKVRAAATQSFSRPSILSFLTDWQNIVNEYRGRNLSFEKDRVIAFAGIATAFSHFSQLTFLAGLWAEIAPAALLWHVEKKPSWLVRLENAIPNGTTVPDSLWTGETRKDNNGDDAVPIKVKNQDPPSWSWFNIPLYKFYQTKFLLSDDELFVRCKAINSPSLVNWADIYSASLRSFAFPGHNTTTAGKVPDSATHDFYGAQITLAAKILSVRENWAADLSARLGAIQQRSSSAADGKINWDPVLEYYPDNVSTSAASPPKSAVYALISETQVVRCAGKNTVQRRFAGLMLVPAEQQGQKGCWKRIGAWKLRLNVVGVSVEAGNIEAVARRWRERSLVEGKWRDGVVTLV